MKFNLIATYEHSHADFSALLLFSSAYLAKKATKAINDSKWVNTQSLKLGESGAFQVGKYVAFNTYSEGAYREIIGMLKKLAVAAPEDDISDLYDSMWDSIADPDVRYHDTRDIAILFFAKVLPGATVEALEETKDNMFAITYRNKKFRAEMRWSGGPRIMFFTEENNTETPDFTICKGNEYIQGIFDEFIEGAEASSTTPETAMFDLLKTIDFSRNLPMATEKKIKGIANLFFQSWLKEATLVGVESSDSLAPVEWVEVWFEYKGKKYHLDFCMEDGKNFLNLWTTNEYEENVDVACVTTGNLQETIDSVTKDGHFPDNSKKEPEETKEDNWVFPKNIFKFDMAGTVKDAEDRFVEFIKRFPEISYEHGNFDYSHEKDYDEITFFLRYKGETVAVTFLDDRNEDETVEVSLGTPHDIGIQGVQDVYKLDKEIAEFLRPTKKSLAERLNKVEHLIASIQEEVEELKKNI